MTAADAVRAAYAKGATDEQIDAERSLQRRHVGTTPFNNMIRALQMHPWHNSVTEWTRLAGALLARSDARRSKR